MGTGMRTAALIVFLLFVGAGVAFFLWRNSPDQKVPRLIDEMANLPVGKGFFYFGRSHDQIQADFDSLGTRAVPGLIDNLKHRDSRIRYLVAGQLGRIKDKRAVEPLMAVLSDSDFVVQYWAIEALGEIGDNRAVEALIPYLKSDDPGFRFRAAAALGQIGNIKTFEFLLPLLEDKVLYPRAYATEALGRVGDARAVDVLLRVLDSKEDSWVRSMAASGLGYFGSSRAIPALKTAESGTSPQVSQAVKEALQRLRSK